MREQIVKQGFEDLGMYYRDFHDKEAVYEGKSDEEVGRTVHETEGVFMKYGSETADGYVWQIWRIEIGASDRKNNYPTHIAYDILEATEGEIIDIRV